MAFPQRGDSGDIWLTPPSILKQLGEFDLDPCAADPRPWDTAKVNYTEQHNGLIMPWFGRVWLNPPYGRGIGKWLERMADHAEADGTGIALIFARTDTKAWQQHVFPHAHGILWISGRITFCRPSGLAGAHPAGAPSALVAYSAKDAEILAASEIHGTYTEIR